MLAICQKISTYPRIFDISTFLLDLDKHLLVKSSKIRRYLNLNISIAAQGWKPPIFGRMVMDCFHLISLYTLVVQYLFNIHKILQCSCCYFDTQYKIFIHRLNERYFIIKTFFFSYLLTEIKTKPKNHGLRESGKTHTPP